MSTFDLGDLLDEEEMKSPAEAVKEMEDWAEDAIQPKEKQAEIYDIETGPRPEEELRAMFHEKTFEEFAVSCDKRWKLDTIKEKFAEYQATAFSDFAAEAALSPVTGRVLLIGIWDFGAPRRFDDSDEATILRDFWDRVDDAIQDKRPLIGHNSNSFDLPFLVRRSWAMGVHVPREVRQGRYWNPLFIDTMEAWFFGERNKYIRLNALGEYFGVGQKTESIAGGDFHKWWFGTMPAECGTPEEQRAKAIEYNGQDLSLTRLIAEKMGLI